MQSLHNPHFIKFIVYFNENQDFFECHEELEEYWKAHQERTKDHPLVAYILLSTGMYHWRRGNTIGGLRTLKKAQKRFTSLQTTFPNFTDGIDFHKLCTNTENAIHRIGNNQPFTSFPIVITSAAIHKLVNNMIPQLELLPAGSDAVIHKHMLRDRSSILRKRDEKKKGR